MCQGTADLCCSALRGAPFCNGCSWVHGLVWWWRDSPTPQHSPSAPGLCLPDQAKQQDRDLLANKLGTSGPAGKELCPVLCVRQRSHCGQHNARVRAGILSMAGLKRVPCVSKKLFLLGLLGLRVDLAMFLLSREIWPYERQSANLPNGVLCLHTSLCPSLSSWMFTV